MNNIKLLDSLHTKILHSKLAETITEQEIDALIDCKEQMKEMYNQALEDLLKQMKERADDCSDIPNMIDKGYYQAYEHMCYEVEQLKK